MRTTGATDSQIEAAAKRKYEAGAFAADRPWDRLSQSLKNSLGVLMIRDHAQFLVRPDQRIVDVADLRALMSAYECMACDAEDENDRIYRITALLE